MALLGFIKWIYGHGSLALVLCTLMPLRVLSKGFTKEKTNGMPIFIFGKRVLRGC